MHLSIVVELFELSIDTKEGASEKRGRDPSEEGMSSVLVILLLLVTSPAPLQPITFPCLDFVASMVV